MTTYNIYISNKSTTAETYSLFVELLDISTGQGPTKSAYTNVYAVVRPRQPDGSYQ